VFKYANEKSLGCGFFLINVKSSVVNHAGSSSSDGVRRFFEKLLVTLESVFISLDVMMCRFIKKKE
jgi:hypothetical protein